MQSYTKERFVEEEAPVQLVTEEGVGFNKMDAIDSSEHYAKPKEGVLWPGPEEMCSDI